MVSALDLLAIGRMLVGRLGVGISVTSEEGRGTTFTLDVPVYAATDLDKAGQAGKAGEAIERGDAQEPASGDSRTRPAPLHAAADAK